MSRRRTDWAADEARKIVDLTAGLSREVSVNYIASVLRLASQRGGIEASRAKPAAKETLV